MGILTEVDGLALESLAETYSDLRNAREALAARGGLVYATTNVAGNAMHRSFPELALIDAADRRFRMWCSAFGLSPSDRSKVSAVDKAELDPAERYFQRKSHPD